LAIDDWMSLSLCNKSMPFSVVKRYHACNVIQCMQMSTSFIVMQEGIILWNISQFLFKLFPLLILAGCENRRIRGKLFLFLNWLFCQKTSINWCLSMM
jgi:hypothetical protein